jgi:hypothetical protein
MTDELKATLYTYTGLKQPVDLQVSHDPETGIVTIYFTKALAVVNADYIEIEAVKK